MYGEISRGNCSRYHNTELKREDMQLGKTEQHEPRVYLGDP